MTRTKTLLTLVLVMGLAVILVLAAVDDGEPQAAGDALLPDLWSSAPFELTLGELDGRAVIRFTTEINNKGEGDFMVRGSTRDGDFSQWIAHADEGFTVTPVDVAVVWGGDTHFHWHIEDVAGYWIEPLDGEPLPGRFDNKIGFCFFDGVDRLSDLAAAPSEPVHLPAGCGSRLDPDLAMGLSVGWGDQYRFDLRGQYIDIEDLPTGQYKLVAEVDPLGLFTEANTANNRAETEFTLLVSDEGNRTLLG